MTLDFYIVNLCIDIFGPFSPKTIYHQHGKEEAMVARFIYKVFSRIFPWLCKPLDEIEAAMVPIYAKEKFDVEGTIANFERSWFNWHCGEPMVRVVPTMPSQSPWRERTMFVCPKCGHAKKYNMA